MENIEDDNYNVDDDPNILDLDFSQLEHVDTKSMSGADLFSTIQIKNKLPEHINDVLEKELSLLMNSITLICLKNTGFEDIKAVFNKNIKISLIREIEKNLIYLRKLNKKKQNLAVRSIIGDYLFNVHVVIALATGNKEKIAKLLKFDKTKYDKKDFQKALDLRAKFYDTQQ